MTVKKKDHWSTLASMLGMGGKAVEEEVSPVEVETPASETPVAEAPSVEPEEKAAPAPEASIAPPAAQEVSAPPKPTKPAAPKRRDHWGSLLGQLGLQTPPAEPEEVEAEAVEEAPAAAAPIVEEVDVPEGPPGYTGPNLEKRIHIQSERPARPRGSAERSRGADDRGRRSASRSRPETRRSPEDEIDLDEELDSGLRALWASHEETASLVPTVEAVEDFEDEDLEEAPARDAAAEEERPIKRKRRRRGRRRRGEEREAPPAQHEELELDAELDELEVAEEEEELVKPIPAARKRDEEEERPQRKRRRRRRRKEETEKTGRVADEFEADEDEFDGPASVDYLGEADKGESHKRIPTWDDAIGAIVAANIEARGQRPQSRGREGRGGRRN